MDEIKFFGAGISGVPYALFAVAMAYVGYLVGEWRKQTRSVGWLMVAPLTFLTSLADGISPPSNLAVGVLFVGFFGMLGLLFGVIKRGKIVEALGLGVAMSLMAAFTVLAESTSSRGQSSASYASSLHEAAKVFVWASQSLAIVALGAGALTICFAIQRRQMALIRADEADYEAGAQTPPVPVSSHRRSTGRCGSQRPRS